VLAVFSSSPRRLDGCCNPDIAAMLCSVMSTMPPPSPSQP
jgi:hypothetical protein